MALHCIAWKMIDFGVNLVHISEEHLSVFSQNAGKYGSE